MLESKLTDCKSVTSLQSEQLAVLQSEVDQLRCSLAAAEKLAGGSATDEQLRQEVKELRSRLQVRQLQSEHRSGCVCLGSWGCLAPYVFKFMLRLYLSALTGSVCMLVMYSVMCSVIKQFCALCLQKAVVLWHHSE